MYVQRNIEARSRKYCCCGKGISIACAECVSVVLFIQHAKSTPAWVYHLFPSYLKNGTIFGTKSYRKENGFFDILQNFCLKYFAF